MKTNRGFVGVIIGIIVLVALVAGGIIYQSVKKPAALPDGQLVGNDRDAHGCIPSAGYSWCEVKQKCLRVWEEKCEAIATTNQAIDTKDWKTYTNTQYGFEFKYPATWNVTLENKEWSDSINIVSIINPARAGKPDTDAPIEDFTVRVEKITYLPCGDLPITFGNIVGTGNNWSEGFGLIYYRDICFKTQTMPLRIFMSAFDKKSEVLMDGILSTFKFIPQ